jgi:Ferritin-like
MRTAIVTEDDQIRQVLVTLLQQASQLEHCLLDAYLYAACSIKSMPWEFATLSGRDNRRRGIQFERSRAWKQNILNVAHEEMLHLHYVQCMLRALGEPPHFTLPDRDQEGSWYIPGWQTQIGAHPQKEGTRVPVDGLTLENAKNFVLYESTDSLQDENPFGPEVNKLFNELYDFELDIRLESVVFVVDEPQARNRLKQQLWEIYTHLTPSEAAVEVAEALEMHGQLPTAKDIRFQSIADLYKRGILPLYEQAFDFGWVKHSNLNLDNEQLDPAHAAEGFLPIGPVFRSPRFARFHKGNVTDPLRNYKRVSDIVNEIVEEGEGFTLFFRRATSMLAAVAANGGSRALLKAIVQGKDFPSWVNEAQLLRKSHLYQFAMILTELSREVDISKRSNADFRAVREPIAVSENTPLQKLAVELPSQFNACYLVMIAWLSRMYELQDWNADKPRRLAIEMIATWPLMSLAIRPALEIASFVGINKHQLFRWDDASLPDLPVTAKELLILYESPERGEEVNQRLDFLAMRTLAQVGAWADGQIDPVEYSSIPVEPKRMILSRLRALSRLNEFEKQFPFRVHGGYSGTMPDLTYQNRYPDAYDFSEDTSDMQPPTPPTRDPIPAYRDTLVARLRFKGWGLVQLSTDPDPPTDESGCTGTVMLHPADGEDRRLDRALVWQNFDKASIILRGPKDRVPPLGVNCFEASLLVTEGQTVTGYAPIQIMNSAGAVQASGVQQNLSVSGLNEIVTLKADQILAGSLRLFLSEKDGVRPHLEGLNHLVWQDGEPIDPFILNLYAESEGGSPTLLVGREIYNRGLTILEMEPLQRLVSARAPCGFDSVGNLPSWGKTPELEEALSTPGFPVSYLEGRGRDLAMALQTILDDKRTYSPEIVDEIASLAERMLLVSAPSRRGTTVGWLPVLLHYGHTISGDTIIGAQNNPILKAFEARTNLKLDLAPAKDRSQPNSRWLVGYTKGIMDVDATRDYIYGELYIPLAIQGSGGPVSLYKKWSFPAGTSVAVSDYACNFAKPFWTPYVVDGNTRTTQFGSFQITETLREGATTNSYEYAIAGVDGIESCQARFAADTMASGTDLTWNVRFGSTSPAAVVQLLTYAASSARMMASALAAHFSPS